ncbi:hypothetical protein ACK340_13725, partial [Aeromonas veronii]
EEGGGDQITESSVSSIQAASIWATTPHNDHNKYQAAERRLTTKAFQLGEEFAVSSHNFDELGPNLFSNDYMPYRTAFGRGLAKGGHDLYSAWLKLVEYLEIQPAGYKNLLVFEGFIEEVDSIDPALAKVLLDQCAQHPQLRHGLVELHPRRNFTEADLDRCMNIMDDSDIHPSMYESILWRDEYGDLSRDRVIDLAIRLLRKPRGFDVVLRALSMRLHGKESGDQLGLDFRQIGLKAAILSLPKDHCDPSGMDDYNMECVINAALRFDGNEPEKQEWLDAIFAVVDLHYGDVHSYESAIETTASLMPEAFLNRVFEGTEEQQKRRWFFICNSDLRFSPLSHINMDFLIAWCCARNEPRVWGAIAASINLWDKDEEIEKLEISELALRLLEASPSPAIVLEIFAERVTPSSYSGSRAEVMQSREKAIRKLVEHERADISTAAQRVSANLIQLIERQKEREQREDMEHEQRFE